MPTMGGLVQRPFPLLLEVQDDPRFAEDEKLIDTGFPALFRMSDVAVPLASSVTLKKEKQPEAKMAVVMRTSPDSVHLTGDSQTIPLLPRSSEFATKLKGLKPQQFAIAANVEGTLKSAFAEGDKQGVEAPTQSAKTSRVFVLASSQFLANPFARAGNGPDMGQFGMMMPDLGGDEQLKMLAGPYAQQFITTTILILKNTLDWITGDTDLLAVSAKLTSEPNLTYGIRPKLSLDQSEEQIRKEEEGLKESRKTQQRNVELLLILGLPLLLAGYGLLRWRMRLAARATLSL
jgi:hypothetical protein